MWKLLTKKETFEQRPDRDGRAGQVIAEGRVIQGGVRKGKAPRQKVLVGSRTSRSVWLPGCAADRGREVGDDKGVLRDHVICRLFPKLNLTLCEDIGVF